MPPPVAIAVVLSTVFILAKLPIAWKLGQDKRFLSWVGISAEDILCALAFWAVAALMNRLLAKKPVLLRRLGAVLLGLASVFALYAVMNIGIFKALKQPLNSRVLAMAKHVGDLGSSVKQYCTVPMVTAMVLVPVLTWWLSKLLGRYVDNSRFRRGFLTLALAWVTVGLVFMGKITPDAWQQRAGRNAHREIVFSIVSDFVTGGKLEMGGDFPAENLADFKPAASRRMDPWPKPPRNVVLFVLESTSAEYMKLYGASYNTTPNLIKEAGNSLIFEHAYAHVGYTFSSFITLTYGIYPGLPWQYRPGGEAPMPKGFAACLKERGYRTGYFSAASPEWGGMDYMGNKAGIEDVLGPDQLSPGAKNTSWGCEDGPMLDGLLKWIDKEPTRPFFAMTWTDQTHHPYTVSKVTPAVEFTDDGKPVDEDKNRYLNAIRQADYQLGRLFAFLRERGLDKNTLVVITGDHGEAFGSPHPVMGHGSALFDENLHVPLIFWSPTMFAGGQKDDKPCGHVDVIPTLAHMLSVQQVPDWQGCSLFSPEHPKRVYMMADRDGFQFGAVEGTKKQILYASGGYHRLYDLATDPLEQTDIAPANPGIADALNGRIRAFVHFQEAYLKGEPLKPRLVEPQLGVVSH